MDQQARRWLLVASIVGALAVVLGAFGAHGVPHYLEGQGFEGENLAKRLADFETAARYHMYAAFFLVAAALVADRQPTCKALLLACWSMLVGMLLFSGSVYAVALVPDDLRGTFGAIAPFGGTLMIVAWASLAVAARRKSTQSTQK
ncbi:DUF423 domain-containing protein [Aeoliella sp. ICT_H6.2]|uniref:DUF423 domain-containing protein n=1 Tax=Aeoliella straminimaris TaxID=2954799 RepID=A0A9X2JF13_9BACT|nr:DUF423 domain-containing protein [Aeoliella straminimaris]MCO6042792.1 DUF423 domain-containing protein [Aeoliella straminimaris]